MFYSMGDKCLMTPGKQFQYFGNKQVIWKYVPVSTTNQVRSFFKIELVLVATSCELWMM